MDSRMFTPKFNELVFSLRFRHFRSLQITPPSVGVVAAARATAVLSAAEGRTLGKRMGFVLPPNFFAPSPQVPQRSYVRLVDQGPSRSPQVPQRSYVRLVDQGPSRSPQVPQRWSPQVSPLVSCCLGTDHRTITIGASVVAGIVARSPVFDCRWNRSPEAAAPRCSIVAGIVARTSNDPLNRSSSNGSCSAPLG